MNVLGKYSGLIVAPDAETEARGNVAAVNVHSQLVGMPGQATPRAVNPVVTPEQQRQLHWNAIANMVGIPTMEGSEGQQAVRGTLTGDSSKGKKGSFSWSL